MKKDRVKMLVIDSCFSCGFRGIKTVSGKKGCVHPKYFDASTGEPKKVIPDAHHIPKWCPLPDAPQNIKE